MSDIFLCYRGHGAQTAKLFHRYMLKQGFDEVWYSDDEACGNYKQDIPALLANARCAILFITRDFCKGFSPIHSKEIGTYQCITQLEIEEIERNLQQHRDFRILTVYLDRKCMQPDEERLLEQIFQAAGILQPDSVSHFSQSNMIPFNTRRDDEEELFAQLQSAVYSQDTFRVKTFGNFLFGSQKTNVDIVQMDVKKPIFLDFSQISREISFYRKVNRLKSDIIMEQQNDQMISVTGWQSNRETNTDNLELTIYYKIIDYHLFHKCLQLWNSPALKIPEKMFCYDSNNPDMTYEIPNAMGLALMVFTKDGYLVFSRRSKIRRIRSEEYDCSIVEGLKPEVGGPDGYDIYDADYVQRECIRAYREEISFHSEGITPVVNGILLDKQYGQWNITGTIFDDKTKAQLEHEHPFREDTYEQNQLIFVKPEELSQSLQKFQKMGLWDTALATLYLTLLRIGIDPEEFLSK